MSRGKWLLRRPRGEAASRLFLFPYSGLGASMYSKWPASVGGAEVCAVQFPSRENRIREPHYGTYEELAANVAEGLLPYLDRPFGFFGHCGGALPAFATALHLFKEGLPTPDWLFMSSQVSPHDGPFGRWLGLNENELRAELELFFAKLGAQPNPDIIEMGLGVLIDDLEANKKYHLDEPVEMPSALHAIGWDVDKEIRPEQMGGWARYTAEDRFHRAILPGDHHTFLGAPEGLLEVLADAMALGATEDSTEGTGERLA
ncbi:thioesterase II family protein [Kitasatospora sp. NPDC058162]|uniref:thioesterase II family protein n=1 Tax=Kitasatospora sp. NPDC058162 TaxID=3346362 RepID=UPI0036DDACA4